ncbi:MAG: DUF2868 domain-containing protein [Thermodesulfobacteriota bacterium]
MNMEWRLEDLVDLEYFLGLDQDRSPAELVRRDRDLFLRELSPDLEGEGVEGRRYRRILLRLWLERRRRMEDAAIGKPPLPGALFSGFQFLIRILAGLTGIVAGFGLSGAFLNYRGMEPLNVWTYLGLFVFLQIGLLLLIPLYALPWRCFGMARKPGPLALLLRLLFSRTLKRVYASMPASARVRMESTAGRIIGKTRQYGTAFHWWVFICAQMFGVGFNLGVVSGSLIRVIGSDLAFGWQSTLQWSAGTIHAGVKILALPWSWLFPAGSGYPTLAQIEGSRMIYKDGMAHLTTPDLVSWWPFLLLAVLFYGLLPRLLLLLTGFAIQRRALARLGFRHTACEELFRRLTSPILETGGRPSPESIPVRLREGTATGISSGMPIDGIGRTPDPEGVAVLVPEAMADRCSGEELDRVLAARLGLGVGRILVLPDDPVEGRSLLRKLSETPFDQVVVLQEAWQPPIFESLRFVREGRKILGDKTRMDLLLIGRPAAETILTKSHPVEAGIWREKIAGLGDPYLGCYDL